MNQAILALNIGSSSIKLAVFDTAALDPIVRGAITGIGRTAQATFDTRAGGEPPGQSALPEAVDIQEAARWLLETLRHRHPELRIAAVAHRIVHGGTRFTQAVSIDRDVLAELEALAPLAPAHQPAAIAVIRRMQELLPGIPQIACFDTAFHRSQPKLSQWFALPRALSESGIVRIGFHGLSYEYIASVLPAIAGTRARGRVVVAHLGHGASVCGMRALRSVATSMGFTPLAGLMMATRCGAIDPGVLLYLLQQRAMGVSELADLLGNQSGLLGVSGISDDVRVLEASDDPRANQALDMFAERAASAIAVQCSALGGLDVLAFTGGIGEHSSGTRARICARLQWLGVELDADANGRHAQQISKAGAPIPVYVVPTDEEIVMARAVQQLIC